MLLFYELPLCSELHLFAKTTPTTLTKNTDLRPRKKPILKGKKKSNNSNGRRGHSGGLDDADSIGGDDDLGTTQIMAGSTQEGQRTDRPLVVPSLSPPWVILNAANFRHPSISTTAILLLLLLPTTL